MKAARFFNRQRAVALDRKLLRQLVRSLLEESLGHRDYELGVHFIAAAEMARLNETFLGHQGSTDVITFDHREPTAVGPLYGEIFISVDDALAYARRFHVHWTSELARYIIHGVLHLEGFDDTTSEARRVMKRRENGLLKNLSARIEVDNIAKK